VFYACGTNLTIVEQPFNNVLRNYVKQMLNICSTPDKLNLSCTTSVKHMTQHIGFRCPDDLIEAIQSEIGETGKDRTTVIIEALRRGFGLPMADDTEQLKAELNAVKQRLSVVEGKLTA